MLGGLTVDLGDLPDFIRNSWFMDFKFERICIWVEILIWSSQNDYAEVFGVITDLRYRRVNEGRVVIHVFQSYQQSPSASSRRVAYRERGEMLAHNRYNAGVAVHSTFSQRARCLYCCHQVSNRTNRDSFHLCIKFSGLKSFFVWSLGPSTLLRMASPLLLICVFCSITVKEIEIRNLNHPSLLLSSPCPYRALGWQSW